MIAPTEVDIVDSASGDARRDRQALVNADHTAAQINLRLAGAASRSVRCSSTSLKADLDARIAALDLDADSILLTDLAADQEAVSATPAGLATVGIGLLENLSSNRAALTYLALVPGRVVPGAAVPQLEPGDAGAGAGVPGGGRLVVDRRVCSVSSSAR